MANKIPDHIEFAGDYDLDQYSYIITLAKLPILRRYVRVKHL